MRYEYKFYLWENGAKSTDYSSHIAQPLFTEDRLDETLNSGQVVLESMPLESKKPFPPKTKFRLEQLDGLAIDEDGNEISEDRRILKAWDFVVEHDDVEEEECRCVHRVHLIEPSAVAQGMHCDNFALTYELQDVTMNYRTTQSTEVLVVVDVSPPRGHNVALM
ncbi:MAG: hypothetical protein FWE03_06240 [Firmicutes bacterium]|nr:hypothetical protein [Bacillota bacterium]